MSLDVTKSTETQYNPVFQMILEDVPGGRTFTAARFPTAMTEVKAGTLVFESGNTDYLWDFIKTAQPLATSSGVTLSVSPGQIFKAGDRVASPGATAAKTGYAIASISYGDNTDTIVLNTATTVGATSDTLYEASAAGTLTRAHSAEGILRNNLKLREDDGTTLNNVSGGIVVRGTVNESSCPYPAIGLDKTSLTSRIRFV